MASVQLIVFFFFDKFSVPRGAGSGAGGGRPRRGRDWQWGGVLAGFAGFAGFRDNAGLIIIPKEFNAIVTSVCLSLLRSEGALMLVSTVLYGICSFSEYTQVITLHPHPHLLPSVASFASAIYLPHGKVVNGR